MESGVIAAPVDTTTQITNDDIENIKPQHNLEQAEILLKRAQELIKRSKALMQPLCQKNTEEKIDLEKNSDANNIEISFAEQFSNLEELDDSIEDSIGQLDAINNCNFLEDISESQSDDEQDLFDVESDVDDEAADEQIISIDGTAKKLQAASSEIIYAPQQPILQGTKNLCCIRIVWRNGGSNSKGEVQRAGNAVQENYSRLSGGLLKINVAFVAVDVTYSKSYRYVKAASSYAKNVANRNRPGGKYDMYAIFTGGAAGVSRAGGNTATMRGASAASHEVGHILGFEHTHRFDLQPQFRNRPGSTGRNGIELNLKLYRFNSSADGSSIMSRFASNQLTAWQLYSKGWLKREQVAQHDQGSPPKVYHLQTVSSNAVNGYVKAVVIPRSDEDGEKDLFLSALYVKGKGKQPRKAALTLHLANPSSMRILTFGNAPTTVLGHTFEAIKNDGNFFDVRISPHVPKPKVS